MDFSSWDAFWQSLETFLTSAWGTPVRVVLIVGIAIVIRLVLQFVIRRVVNRVITGVKKRQGVDDTQLLSASPSAAARVVQRTRALGGVLSGLVTGVIVIVTILLVIATISPDATGAFALITAALGAGLGFGAQGLVRDVLAGIFLVADDQYGVGDVIDLGVATGVVESVDIRVTRIRDVNGTLWYVRNGEVARVGNLSQGWGRVILDVKLPYDADVESVEDHILATATAMTQEGKWRRLVVEKPELWGIESISGDGIVVRLAVKTRSGSRDDVARELRVRLKRALDEIGVRIPTMTTTVLTGYEGAGSVKGPRPPKTAQVPVAESDAAPQKPRREPPEQS